MKTIPQIQDEVAKENGFVHWLEILEDHIDTEPYWPEVCKRYAIEETKKLQAFKDYVHKRLDDAGIEKDPESVHKNAGCRIGGRLDIVLNDMYTKKQVIEVAKASLEKASGNPIFVITNDLYPGGLRFKMYTDSQMSISVDKSSITSEDNILL